MKPTHNFKVGQLLWYVPHDNRFDSARYARIMSIGVKWINFDSDAPIKRAEIATLKADGASYSSPGMCYLSEEAYKHHTMRVAAWQKIKEFTRDTYTVPATISDESLSRICTALGIVTELPPPSSAFTVVSD